MAITIISTVPAQGATQVLSTPAVIEIRFSGAVNRALAETGFTITPAQSETFIRWTTMARNVPGSGTTNVVMDDILRICFPAPMTSNTTMKVTLAKAKIKAATGTDALAADYVLSFQTKAQGLHVRPSNFVIGDTRDNIPAGGYKRAIVLSGGGAKGDFQVGVLKYLYNTEGFYPDLVVGTSVGAINASKLAEADTVAEHKAVVVQMEALWRSLRVDEDVFKPTEAYKALLKQMGKELNISIPLHFLTFGLDTADEIEDYIEACMVKIDAVRKTTGLYNFDPLRAKWLSLPALDAAKVFASKTALSLGAVELYRGNSTFFHKTGLGNDPLALQQAIIASASMPVFIEALKWGDKVYTDGGVREVAGLAEALRQGATDIVVIPTYSFGGFNYQPRLNANKYGTLEAVLGRTLSELVFDEMLVSDIQSEIQRQMTLNLYAGKEVRIRVVDPEIEIHTSLNFDPEGVARGLEHGEDMARVKLGGITRKPVPHPTHHTRTSAYLVVNPKFPNGTHLPDPAMMFKYDGGLSEDTPTGLYADVRIVVREGGKVIHAYPGDRLREYSEVCVPGSDPDLSGALNPYLKGRRKGQFYAFPLHATNESQPISATALRPTNLEVEVVSSVVVAKVYKEVRTKQNVTFAPNPDGIHALNFTMGAPYIQGGGKSRRVILFGETYSGFEPHGPTLTIHGAVNIPNIKALVGHDFKDLKGRWESSRDAKWLPDLDHLSIFIHDVKVTVYKGVNYTGESKVMAPSTMIDPYTMQGKEPQYGTKLTWPIMSIKVEFV